MFVVGLGEDLGGREIEEHAAEEAEIAAEQPLRDREEAAWRRRPRPGPRASANSIAQGLAAGVPVQARDRVRVEAVREVVGDRRRARRPPHAAADLEGRADRDAVHGAVADHRGGRRQAHLGRPRPSRSPRRRARPGGAASRRSTRWASRKPATNSSSAAGTPKTSVPAAAQRLRQQVEADHAEHQAAGQAQHQMAAVGHPLCRPAAGQRHQERAERDEDRHGPCYPIAPHVQRTSGDAPMPRCHRIDPDLSVREDPNSHGRCPHRQSDLRRCRPRRRRPADVPCRARHRRRRRRDLGGQPGAGGGPRARARGRGDPRLGDDVAGGRRRRVRAGPRARVCGWRGSTPATRRCGAARRSRSTGARGSASRPRSIPGVSVVLGGRRARAARADDPRGRAVRDPHPARRRQDADAAGRGGAGVRPARHDDGAVPVGGAQRPARAGAAGGRLSDRRRRSSSRTRRPGRRS